MPLVIREIHTKTLRDIITYFVMTKIQNHWQYQVLVKENYTDTEESHFYHKVNVIYESYKHKMGSSV